jgi:hypothetical protein
MIIFFYHNFTTNYYNFKKFKIIIKIIPTYLIEIEQQN